MKGAGHGCLATADAMGAEATECFGKEKAALRVLCADTSCNVTSMLCI